MTFFVSVVIYKYIEGMLNSSILLQTVTVALFWSMASVLEKYYLLDIFTPYELLILRSLVFFLVGIVLVCIYQPSPLGNIGRNRRYLLRAFFIFLLGIVGTLTFWKTIQKNNVGVVSSMVGPLRIVFAVSIGYLFYKEMLTKKQVVGVLLAILSVFLISQK